MALGSCMSDVRDDRHGTLFSLFFLCPHPCFFFFFFLHVLISYSTLKNNSSFEILWTVGWFKRGLRLHEREKENKYHKGKENMIRCERVGSMSTWDQKGYKKAKRDESPQPPSFPPDLTFPKTTFKRCARASSCAYASTASYASCAT